MRTAFWPFRRAVCSAERVCKGKGYVTLDALSCALNTKPWAELRDPSSQLSRMLLSEAFTGSDNDNRSLQRINKDTLIMFALLHCRDRRVPTQKARGLYELL